MKSEHHLFEIEAKIVINVESSNMMTVLKAFLLCLGPLLENVLSQVMLHYAALYAENGQLRLLLGISEQENWHWKSKVGYAPITVKSLFGKIRLPNPIVVIKRQDGRILKMTIGRKLIEISPYFQIPNEIKGIIGTLGGLISYRNVSKSMASFSILGISLSSIWRALQWTAEGLVLCVESTASQDVCFEVDATGAATVEGGKRGSEIKVLMQRKESGGLGFMGVKVGAYKNKSDWESLFSSLKPLFNKAKRFVLIADGDKSPIEAWTEATKGVYSLVQRCLWHIPHQLKYMLWKDKAQPEQRKTILSLAYSAILLRKQVSIEEFNDYIQLKILRVENLISDCQKNGLKTCATFLKNAKDQLFIVGRNAKDNHNTSLTERAMRTIKQRTKYAYWSEKGVENVVKVRLNHFYNQKFKGLYFET